MRKGVYKYSVSFVEALVIQRKMIQLATQVRESTVATIRGMHPVSVGDQPQLGGMMT